jgi:hypothetical protein
MARFLAIFAVVLILGLVLMAGTLSRYGFSLLDPEVRIMTALCVAVAAYVAWRISTILKRRAETLSERPAPGGAGQGKLAGIFAPRSKALDARRAELEARRKRLIEEGKLAPGAEPQPEAADPPPRAAASASLKDKMAARAERVRRAKEDGKL